MESATIIAFLIGIGVGNVTTYIAFSAIYKQVHKSEDKKEIIEEMPHSLPTEKHPTIKQMILNVIENGDTARDIFYKINVRYPSYHYRKVIDHGNETEASAQTFAEIDRITEQNEVFTINKNGKLSLK